MDQSTTTYRGNMVLTITLLFCVLSCLPVISYGLDLPFLTEARNRNSQPTDAGEENSRQPSGILSELLPSSRVNTVPKGQLTDIMRVASPPKHIVKLLQKMSLDQDLLQRRGNTVRSVVPTRRNVCGKESFVFPLRTMGETEQLHAIELHYFVRKLKRWSDDNLRLNVHFHLINNDTLVCHELGSLQLPPGVRGWQTLNMTSYIDRLMNETSLKILIGVSFTVTTDRNERKVATVSDGALVRKILSKHVKPFMLVYTEDHSASEEASTHLSWQRIAKDLSGRSKENPSRRRRTRSVSNIVTNNTYSLITNEFPEDITKIAGEATFPFFAEQNSRRRKARKKEKEKKRRQKNKKGKHSKHQPLLDQQSGESEEVEEEDRNQNSIQTSKVGLCSRKPMRVDFNMIGWDGYVIAPEGFDAYYCDGQCPFPLTKDVELSNHAAIQSVVSALGAVPNVPAPCCVPEKMSPISILFFDEDKNVALKSYQNMQVDSCACR